MTTLGSSEKGSQLFLKLTYGDPADPTIIRLAQYTKDQHLGEELFTACPELEVRPVEISGVLSDKSLVFMGRLSLAGGFFDNVSNGQPFSPIFADLWEKLEGTEGQPTRVLKLFRGRVTRVTRNYQNPERVLIEVLTIKQRIDMPLGIPANPQCAWVFGGRQCRVVVPTSEGTVDGIDGKTITITGLDAVSDRTWHRGYVQRNGLRILIREWVSGTAFELVREPPADWDGEDVTVFAGCDKSIETCRARWDNEANFGGFGYAIPAYSPNWELV